MNEIENKLNNAIQILKETNLIEEMEPDELVHISNEIQAKDTKKVAQIISYIRKRDIEKYSRVEAFKHSFPERCIAQEPERGSFRERRDGTIVEKGDPLPDRTIELKAKRLENSNIYKGIMVIMNTSVYAVFALDRMSVLEKALEKINDESVSDRNKVEYMKLFLQETRKPEKAQELEINVNLQQNNVSIEQINNKLDDIANQMVSCDAGSIIELIDKD